MIIGRGRRREHLNQHCLLLWVLHNFRLRIRTQREPRSGSSDIWSHPVAMVLILRKKRGKKPGMRRTYFRSRPLPDRASSSDVTLSLPVKMFPLGRILCNFRLRMRRTYFRTGHMTDVTSGHVTDVTFGHVTSGSTLSVPIYYCRYFTLDRLIWWKNRQLPYWYE
jgi:hypothetical protein